VKLSDPQAHLLWHVHVHGLPEPVTEHRFHPIRRWRFDLAWPDRMLAVEVDGGVFSGGRHVRGKGFEEDLMKLNEAALLGWKVLRFSSGQVRRGVAIQVLRRVLDGGRIEPSGGRAA
jgi:very-short-patch-repair endonuclease